MRMQEIAEVLASRIAEHAWCQETLLDWLHIATDEEVELYKKVMGIE